MPQDENPLETFRQVLTGASRALAREPELVEGMEFEERREGHPERHVGRHVADLLERLDEIETDPERRERLRFIVLVHDAFKFRQRELPKEPGNHHARLACRFAERYTDERSVLSTIEWHDWPFMLWKRLRHAGVPDEEMFDDLARRVPDPDLFIEFCELDASTEGKDPEPVHWLKHALRAHQHPTHAPAAEEGDARPSSGTD